MRESGATVAELVIATLILGAALVPIYSIFTNSSKAAGNSKYAYMTAQLAREMMEELRTIPFDKLEDANTSTPKAIEGGLFANTAKLRAASGTGTDVSGTATYPEEYKRFKYTLKIEAVDGTGLPQAITGQAVKPRLKKATLDIVWEESGGVNEKSRPALQHYVSFLGNHSVDPEVPE